MACEVAVGPSASDTESDQIQSVLTKVSCLYKKGSGYYKTKIISITYAYVGETGDGLSGEGKKVHEGH